MEPLLEQTIGDRQFYSEDMGDILMVEHHENGIHCDVIFFGGSDYGAYISESFTSISSTKFETVFEEVDCLYQLKIVLGYGLCNFIKNSDKLISAISAKEVLELEKSLKATYIKNNPFQMNLIGVVDYSFNYRRKKDSYVRRNILEVIELSEKIKG